MKPCFEVKGVVSYTPHKLSPITIFFVALKHILSWIDQTDNVPRHGTITGILRFGKSISKSLQIFIIPFLQYAQFFYVSSKTESAGLPAGVTQPLPLRLVRGRACEQSVRVTCVYDDDRRRWIPGTFSLVEKHEVCCMDIFPVTQTNYVPYTTMFRTF